MGVANAEEKGSVESKPKSCLRTDSAHAPRERQVLSFYGIVEAHCDAEPEPWTEVLTLNERQGKRKADKPPATLPDTYDIALSQLMAWTKAKELSQKRYINTPCTFAWPVLWFTNEVIVGGPHPEHHKGRDLTTHPRMPEMMSRVEAESYFTHPSLNYHHFGFVPPHIAGGPLADATPTFGGGSMGAATLLGGLACPSSLRVRSFARACYWGGVQGRAICGA